MGKKLFRYMFENAPNALIMTASMWDKENDDITLSVYSSEFIERNCEEKRKFHIFQSKKILKI